MFPRWTPDKSPALHEKYCGTRIPPRFNALTSHSQIPDPGSSEILAQGDEDRFFEGLYTLPEFVEVKWDGSALQLTLRKPVSRDSFKELIALFARYQVSLRLLRPAISALSSRNRSHFARPETYWFEELFGSAG